MSGDEWVRALGDDLVGSLTDEKLAQLAESQILLEQSEADLTAAARLYRAVSKPVGAKSAKRPWRTKELYFAVAFAYLDLQQPGKRGIVRALSEELTELNGGAPPLGTS